MNMIFIHELKVKTRLGVPDWERLKPQTVLLDIEIALPSTASFDQDRIDQTIDYGVVCQQVSSLLQQGTFQLVETIAQQVCALIQQQHAAPWVKVKISKPNILPHAKYVGVVFEAGKRPD